jgi:hypothetical protein
VNWQLFFTTFVTIFLAELGDKTQFAAVAAASQSDSTREVLLAVVLALSFAGTVSVSESGRHALRFRLALHRGRSLGPFQTKLMIWLWLLGLPRPSSQLGVPMATRRAIFIPPRPCSARAWGADRPDDMK